MHSPDPEEFDDESLSEEELRDIEISLQEIERGEVYPLEDVIREIRRREQ